MNDLDIIKAEVSYILETRGLVDQYTVDVGLWEGCYSIDKEKRRDVVLAKTRCTTTGVKFTIAVPCPVTRKQKQQFFNTFCAEIKSLEKERIINSKKRSYMNFPGCLSDTDFLD